MRYFLILPLLLCSFHVIGQSNEFIFGNGVGNCIVSTRNKCHVVTGQIRTAQSLRLFLMKLDSAGSISTLHTYADGTEFISEGKYLVDLPNEGYMIAGRIMHDTISNYEITLLKTDTTGAVQWSKHYGNPFRDDQVTGILRLANGYLLVGYSSGYTPGGEDGLIIRVDDSGNTIWSNTYGLSRNERAMKALSLQGKYFIGCEGDAPVASDQDIYLMQIDTSGNISINIEIVIPGDQHLHDMIESPDGALLIAASTQSGGPSDMILMKVMPPSTIQWSKVITGVNAIPQSLSLSPAGFSICGSLTQSTAVENGFVVEMDLNGNIVRQEVFGNASQCNINSLLFEGDTMKAVGRFTKPGNYSSSVFVSSYHNGDSACAHIQGSMSTATQNATTSIVGWQKAAQGMTAVTAAVARINFSVNDSSVCDVTSSVQEVIRRSFELSPNPTTGKLKLKLVGISDSYETIVYSIDGREILRKPGSGRQAELDVTSLSPGLYSIQIVSREGIISGNFVKQ